jgi:transcriptional regulator with XRE-family HTH domain
MTIKVRMNQTAVMHAIARRNMSQNMLAIRSGISSGYISQLMCGTRCPSPRVREKLQHALNPLTFDDIFIIEEDGNNDSQSQ